MRKNVILIVFAMAHSVLAADVFDDGKKIGEVDIPEFESIVIYRNNDLYPSDAWTGEPNTGGVALQDPPLITSKPVARFRHKPYQDITEDTQIEVFAIGYNSGIKAVRFHCEGRTITVNEETQFEDDSSSYVAPLKISKFPRDGGFYVYAEVIPSNPNEQTRVISIKLFCDFHGTLPKGVRYVDAVNGDDANDGSSETPLKTITAARDSLHLAGELGGGTIKLRTGEYKLTKEFPGGPHHERWLSIVNDEGHTATVIGSLDYFYGNGPVHYSGITLMNGATPIPSTDSLWLASVPGYTGMPIGSNAVVGPLLEEQAPVVAHSGNLFRNPPPIGNGSTVGYEYKPEKLPIQTDRVDLPFETEYVMPLEEIVPQKRNDFQALEIHPEALFNYSW